MMKTLGFLDLLKLYRDPEHDQIRRYREMLAGDKDFQKTADEMVKIFLKKETKEEIPLGELAVA